MSTPKVGNKKNFSPAFQFKQFSIAQENVAHAVGTDGVLLGAWASIPEKPTHAPIRILDIGTGTGIIALMLAQRTVPLLARIDGVEIHHGSYQIALKNFDQSPWADRLHIFHDNIQHFALHAPTQYDLIVSNPPFFSETVLSPSADRSLGRHIESLKYGELVEAARNLLTPDGIFCVILPAKEGKLLCELAAMQGIYFSKITEVYPKQGKPVERLLIEFSRKPAFSGKDALWIYEDGQTYTKAYKDLTKEFYLKM